MDCFHEVQRSVLPSALQVEFGPATNPPAEEVFKDRKYQPPAHSVKPLQLLHPGTKGLVFFEGPHVYEFERVPASASVTEVVHSTEPPFVAAEAIVAMKNSSKQAWPRFEYVVGASSETAWTPAMGLLIRAGGLTTASVPPDSFAPDTSYEAALQVARLNAKLPPSDEDVVYVYERVWTNEEIEAEWDRNGKEASARGTEAHHQAELFFNGLPCRWWHPDVANVVWFAQNHMVDMEARYTEFEVYFPEADLAGSIDLIVWDRGRELYHIIDHKRSAKLPNQMRGYGKLLAPFQHLDKCSGAVYALQLSLYQYILERVYGFRCGDRVLLTLHPDAPEYATAVPYLKEEVELLVQRRIALVEARRRAVERDATLGCGLTGAPAHDAVTLRDGRTASEKAALVRELPYEPDEPTRKRFRESVDALLEDVPPPAKWAKGTWRRRVPERGLVPFFSF